MTLAWRLRDQDMHATHATRPANNARDTSQ
jgi:hypothetical protein